MYCDGNAVSRADEIGRLWLTIASKVLDVAVAVATVYVMDVIGNIQNKEEGLDILKPTSSIGEYAAAGVAALISIPGIKGAIVRSTTTEVIVLAEKGLTNKQIDIAQAVGDFLFNTVLDGVGEKALDRVVKATLKPVSYESFRTARLARNPQMTEKAIYRAAIWNVRRRSAVCRFMGTVINTTLGWFQNALKEQIS